MREANKTGTFDTVKASNFRPFIFSEGLAIIKTRLTGK
jgi:hypothetical protein